MRMLAALALSVLLSACGGEERTYITLASTTSTKNSGLFDSMLPKFTADTGVEVRVVAVGTGQAIKNAANCDGDVLLVHAKASEEKFIAAGGGVKRTDVMYNDFVIVGPKSDPAGIRGGNDAVAALRAIAEAKALFASRGDDSGTNKKEMGLWKAAGVDAAASSGQWYRETGSGMGSTLNAAAGMGAYSLTDRATWIAFANKGDLELVVEGDKRLFNQYGVILVNPDKFPHVKTADGQAFIDFLIGTAGQKAIAGFQVDGQQLFFPNATMPGS